MNTLDIVEDDDIIIPAWQVELGKIELQNITAGNTELMTWDYTLKLLKFDQTI